MINETKINSQIAGLGRLADKVIELYGMSLKMQKIGCDKSLYAGINAMLLDATTRLHEYWKKLKVIRMSEEDREKIKRITQRTENKIMRIKQVG